ncbi:unnamed protein product [Rhizoctonia solani]|uniref:Uncharacterized protein n=1 Tax=Rhizoctonia solani TaxID=456999 RepID=A0A8H3AGA2_9AGAM|nr:unnamed protein product [Rhizoctonia solani]
MGAISWNMAQVHHSLASPQVIAPRTPPDIFFCIAKCLLAMGRTRDLAMFSLLQRDLSPTIQAILFSHVTLSDFRRCHFLTLTLRFGKATLRPLVHRITATLDTEPRVQGQLFLARDVTELYTLCPMLSHIVLAGGRDGGPGERLFPDILDAPRLGALGTVESLTLTGPPSNFGPSLLFHLPKLRVLHLFGDIPASRFNGSSPSSGKSLRHVTWGLASPPTLALISWLFAYSSQVIGGSLTLITPPSPLEMGRIHEYCSSRGMRIVCLTMAPNMNPSNLS